MPRRNYPKKPLKMVKNTQKCTKKAYSSLIEIEKFIKQRQIENDDVSLRGYLCPKCGKYHLTSA
ncbi:hypothetical protein CR969_00715 [Candidatus Saccharibacteria bacterium]|nr:MAG: hypothetical protein CR969_00715 [Candidatus Saccharibacteria bacterium]